MSKTLLCQLNKLFRCIILFFYQKREKEKIDGLYIDKVKSQAFHYELKEEEEEEPHLSKYFQEDDILEVHQYLIDAKLDAPKRQIILSLFLRSILSKKVKKRKKWKKRRKRRNRKKNLKGMKYLKRKMNSQSQEERSRPHLSSRRKQSTLGMPPPVALILLTFWYFYFLHCLESF